MNIMVDINDLRIDLPEKRPRKGRKSYAPIVVCAVFAVVAAAAWQFGLKERLASPRKVEIYVVPANTAARGGAGEITAGGYLEVIPPGPEIVSVLVEGRVQSLAKVEGDRVEKGEVIAILDPALYSQEVKLRQSSLQLARRKLERIQAGFRTEEIAQAEADLSAARAKLARLEAEYRRAESLFESGVVAQNRLDEAKAEFSAARSEVSVREAELAIKRSGARSEDVEIARAELDFELAALERAMWNESQCTVNAPISGVILERYAQVGDWVSPAHDSNAPGALFSIMEPGSIQAWVDINQREMHGVKPGQNVVLISDSDAKRELPGRVAAIMPLANLQKNTFQAKIEIFEPPPDLLPDMSVKVVFKAFDAPERDESEMEKAVEIPSSALAYYRGERGIYILKSGKAAFKEIVLIEENDGTAFVSSGVMPGDEVILNPIDIKDGDSAVALN